jgi:hypothetical protein
MRILLTLLISSFLLAGCAPNVRQEAKPIQQNLLTKCPPLTKHNGTNGVMVLNTLTRWAAEYNECAARHNGLVDAVKGGV